MEYVEGKTLHDAIGRKGLKIGDTLKYAVQIADALVAAHAVGIVHRDIKPSNIMVSEKGLVKVLDFGLAGPIDPSASTQTMPPRTEEGTIAGTAAYMLPEQVEGKKVDARSDIFSFGSVLYEMVTGRRAFQGENRISTLAAILHQEPASISEAAGHLVVPELQNVIARCLRKDPQRRIQHLDDVKLALEELKQESASGTQAQLQVASVGSTPFESPDGAYIYYVETWDRPSPVWRLPASGGVAVKVLEGVVLSSFVVLEGGIYYLDRPSDDARLQYFDFATRRSRTVARNLANVGPGLTASPDGRTILYSRIDSSVDDLMLVENFR